MTDYPFAEVVRKVAIISSQGMDAYQKFTCVGCGRRVTLGQPNIFLPSGSCDRCKTTTDIARIGCNYEIKNGLASR